jgi:hypothetical protein
MITPVSSHFQRLRCCPEIDSQVQFQLVDWHAHSITSYSGSAGPLLSGPVMVDELDDRRWLHSDRNDTSAPASQKPPSNSWWLGGVKKQVCLVITRGGMTWQLDLHWAKFSINGHRIGYDLHRVSSRPGGATTESLSLCFFPLKGEPSKMGMNC